MGTFWSNLIFGDSLIYLHKCFNQGYPILHLMVNDVAMIEPFSEYFNIYRKMIKQIA